jgi:hypothetical protein
MARRALPFGRMVLVRTPSAHGRLRTAARGHTILAQVFMVLPPSPIEPWDKKSGSNRQRRLLSRWSRFGGRVCAQLAGRPACEMSSTGRSPVQSPSVAVERAGHGTAGLALDRHHNVVSGWQATDADRGLSGAPGKSRQRPVHLLMLAASGPSAGMSSAGADDFR